MNNDFSNLVKMLRDEEFTFVGLCANGSVRVGCRGAQATAIQFPGDHHVPRAGLSIPRVTALPGAQRSALRILQRRAEMRHPALPVESSTWGALSYLRERGVPREGVLHGTLADDSRGRRARDARSGDARCSVESRGR